ncbi:MAG: four helix bundle protein [Candidatus Taylorbacteria bacterium]|nr:four helix bundle protein [Candidatus Taylorbacteria bacterium]
MPIVHKITQFYKNIYSLGNKISKRDKFGIYLKIENICIDLIIISIDTAFNQRENKKPLLYELRIKVETLKQLIRLMKELKIIEDNPYITLEGQLQEISRMASGWIKYLET